jgi:putative hydrolase of the HAD superfamily
MKDKKITTLFLDIGGVLLTNGWGQTARNKTVAHFKLDSEEINERHHLTFDTYEEGKLTLTDYLKRVIFYEKREFSENNFTKFMFNQSLSYPDTIAFFKKIKQRYHLKVIAVSNEGRELNAYRVKKFKLNELFDAFVSSSYVHLRKPDVDIFLMAGDISQTLPENSLFIDDRLMFVKVAQALGINGMHYEGLDKAKAQLKKFGLVAL